MIAAEELRRFPLLKSMDVAGLDALAKAMRRRNYPKDMLLFRKGDPGDTMLLICGGQVRVFLHNEQGHEITLRTLTERQILGEFSLLDRKPRSASASTITPLDALVLQRADFLRLLQERPLVGIELMRSFAERIRYSTAYLERLYDALELLSNSEYEEAIREMALASDEDEMQELITAFVAMVHRVQDRAAFKRSDPPETQK